MDSALYTAASGMIARQRELEVISNNVANASVSGFRPESTFRAVWRRVGGSGMAERELAANTGVRVPGTFTVDRAGALVHTGAPLDVAIEGDAWLVVGSLRGERFVRGGSLRLAADGTLVAVDGSPVLGEAGEIRLPRGRVEIGTDGAIQVEGEPVARLRVERVAARDLTKEGGGLYRLRPGRVPVPLEGDEMVRQGVVEAPAVNAVEELVRLIAAQRAFEQHARTVNLIMNEINRKTINEIAQT